MFRIDERQSPGAVPTVLRTIAAFARALYLWPTFYLALLLLGTIQLTWALLAFLIRHALPTARGNDIGRRVISHVFRHYFQLTGWLGLLRVEATALDAIDRREALVIAPNHPSVLDALILISRLDSLNCIMKASVLDNVLLGAGARLAGYIRNDGPKTMLRASAADLKRGGQVIIFPEGTRTRAAPVNEFKPGFAAIARMAGVPVQTVMIEVDTPYLSKGWSVLRMPPRLPMTFTARLGERFEVEGDVHRFVDDLHTYFVRELADADLGDLWNAPQVGAALHPIAPDPTAVGALGAVAVAGAGLTAANEHREPIRDSHDPFRHAHSGSGR